MNKIIYKELKKVVATDVYKNNNNVTLINLKNLKPHYKKTVKNW